ncbi:hypothetical protein [Streptomyces sp. 351MFTsu5.1]|nr:hypothetical protein [Streptomyces sp. 351MFTsu5.1]
MAQVARTAADLPVPGSAGLGDRGATDLLRDVLLAHWRSWAGSSRIPVS